VGKRNKQEILQNQFSLLFFYKKEKKLIVEKTVSSPEKNNALPVMEGLSILASLPK